MPDYSTSRCPVCKKKFTAEDDIVVCPTCGTPHHRSCYLEAGQCANTELHANGESWAPEAAAAAEEQKLDGARPLRCSRCSTINPPETVYCQICGNKLEENPQNTGAYRQPDYNGPSPIPPSPFTTPFGGVDSDDVIGGVRVRDLTLFVGTSSFYFLPRFKEMEQGVVRVLWNWPALLFHFFYCFYRKMYKVGFLLLGILTLLNLPNLVLSYEYALQLLQNLGTDKLFTFQTAGLETYVTLSYLCQFLGHRGTGVLQHQL